MEGALKDLSGKRRVLQSKVFLLLTCHFTMFSTTEEPMNKIVICGRSKPSHRFKSLYQLTYEII